MVNAEAMRAGELKTVDHLVIGTGFSGIAASAMLVKEGWTDLLIVERAATLGGVWRDNTYPGCACDVPSHLYALADHPDLVATRKYPPQDEVLSYLDTIYKNLQLDRYTVFSVEVGEMCWKEDEKLWHVHFTDGRRVKTKFIHAATGQVPVAVFPDIVGMRTYEGTAFHSSNWRHDVSLENQRVGIVGTGASGVQIIPAIADDVAHLTIFQRNAPYVISRNDKAFSQRQKRLFESSAMFRKLYRSYLYWRHELNALAYFGNKKLLGVVSHETRGHIRKHISDPDAGKSMRPTYKAGCKRILVSDDYYPTLAKENVKLVASAVSHVDGKIVTCLDGTSHEIDVLVFATGFDGTRPVPGIDITGRDSRSLHKEWDTAGVKAFYGTQVSGFPNLFLLIGPNVGLSHNSVLFMMEAQVEYIQRLVEWSTETNTPADVSREAQDAYNEKLATRMEKTIWQTGGCESWYHDEEKRNVGLWPTYTFKFRNELRRLSLHEQISAR